MLSRRTFLKRSSASAVILGIGRGRDLVPGNFSYSSAYYTLELSGQEPRLLAFSTDGLGNSKFAPSPLIPAQSGMSVFRSEATKNRIRYYTSEAKDKESWEISCEAKMIRIRSRYQGKHTGSFAFTVSQVANHATVLGLMTEQQQMRFPCLLHLPGMGTFRMSASEPDLTFAYDASRQVTQPFVKLELAGADEKHPDITYRLESVLIHPEIPGIEKDSRFDGFRRDYINIFQVNPRIRALANNSASDACAFTLFIYAEMARHTPDFAPGVTAMELVGRSLDRYLEGMKAYGQVGYPGWGSIYESSDSTPSLIIAACYYISETHDRVWAAKYYPALLGWARKMMATDTNGDGIIEYGYSGNTGSWNGKVRPSNWWDTIGFGHDDAYSNALAYHALTLLADVSGSLGKQTAQSELSSFAGRLKSHYYDHFYHPETGVLAGWKSEDGQLHDYFFTFVNSVAICYGLLNDVQGKAVMGSLLKKMKEVGYTRFDLGLPGNLVPVNPEDYTDKNPRFGYNHFQVYENGGATGCYAYFTIHALYQLGMTSEAEAILMPMLQGYANGSFQGNCQGSQMTRDWKTWSGDCWGYEGFLVDNYLTLLAVLDRSGTGSLQHASGST